MTNLSQLIVKLRGRHVLLDSDLAALYEVPIKRLNEQVMRNPNRFPADFMFRMNQAEYDSLRLQIATLKKGRGKHRKYLPLVFTEQGVAMLSSVLNSDRAVQVNIAIMRIFVELRARGSSHKALVERLDALETKYDSRFKEVFQAIREMVEQPEPSRRRIGFEP